jgi:gliding motility-associated-like protein
MRKPVILLCFLFLFSQLLYAQCPGTSGPNLLPQGDFGSGSSNISTDTSHFSAGDSLQFTDQVPPYDGFFTITNNTADWQDFATEYWIDIPDNSNDAEGYMMVINQGPAGLVYGVQPRLCPSFDYTLSFDAINLYEPEQPGDTLPNFQLWIDNQLVAELGSLPKDASWYTFSHTFSPGTDQVKIEIRNNRDGGQGNDYALDNISLRACLPDIRLLEVSAQARCPGDPVRLRIDNFPGITNWFYQLQLSIDGRASWLDIGEETRETSFSLNSIPPNAHYRVLAIRSPNGFFNENCRMITEPLSIQYRDPDDCDQVISEVGALCSGARGDNIFAGGDFGRGANNIPGQNPFLAPGYMYVTTPPPNDGSYTITNNTSSWGSFAVDWINIGDNSDDPDGYMMVVNASFEPGIFYQQTVTVCENTNYEFSADVISMNNPDRGSGFIEPNISFLINGIEVYTSGNVPVDKEWHTYGFTFTTRPDVEAIQLTLRNNAPGGFGNDLALDNISFRPCGPGAQVADTTEVCAGAPLSILADVELTSEFPNLALQWQQSTNEGNIWTDLADENETRLAIESPTVGYWYRLKLANNPFNLGTPSCQFFSNYTVIKDGTDYEQIRDTICSNESLLVGDQSFNTSGIYEIPINRSPDCDSIVTLNVRVNPAYDLDTVITICEGDFFPFGGSQLQGDGLYSETFTTAEGCDSLVQLDLQVAPNYQFIDTVTVCFGETYEGRIYFEDTLQTQNLLSLAGCDSTVSQYFNVRIGENITLTEFVCPGESFRGAPIQNDTLVSFGGFNGETCDTVSLINVLVYNDPPVEITGPNLICAGDTARLSVGNYQRYEWSTGATGPTIQARDEGRYSIEVVSENNCIFRDSLFLEVPDFSARLSAKNSTCFAANDGQLEILDLQDAAPPFQTFLNGNDRGNTLRFDGLGPGDYQIALTDQNGCSFQAKATLTEPELFELQLPRLEEINLGDSLNIQASTNRLATEIIWAPATGLSCIDCLTPTASPTQSTSYQLTVRDSMGCEASRQLSINVVKKRDIYVPTAFSPNGDQINDLFYPFDDNNVAEVQLWQVLDRWGNLIWEAQNTTIGSPEIAWDGNHRGQTAPPGVYLWRAVLVYKDQAVRTLSGEVILMR